MDIGNEIKWSNKVEEYLKDLAEKSHAYSYLHKKAETIYDYRRTFIDIPCITLSTICGTLSIGSGGLFGENNEMAGVAIGCGSLLVGILGTINSYFAWGKRAENHRITHLQYGKLYRFIAIELNLPREERIRCVDLMKIVRETYERLQELSPIIPEQVLDEFKKRFKDYKGKIAFPAETNGLEEVEIYKPPSSPVKMNAMFNHIIETERKKSGNDVLEDDEIIVNREDTILNEVNAV